MVFYVGRFLCQLLDLDLSPVELLCSTVEQSKKDSKDQDLLLSTGSTLGDRKNSRHNYKLLTGTLSIQTSKNSFFVIIQYHDIIKTHTSYFTSY